MFPLRPVLVKTGNLRDLIAVVTKLCIPCRLKQETASMGNTLLWDFQITNRQRGVGLLF